MEEKLSEKIKKQAKQIKKELNLPREELSHMQILHNLAQNNGFQSWASLLAHEKENNSQKMVGNTQQELQNNY